MGSENPGFLVYPRTLWLYPIFRHKAILSDQIRSYILCKWGLYGDTVLIPPVVFQGIVRQRHVGSRPPTKLRKERVPLPCTIETLETVRKTSKQLANQHIRNRDNSVHRLSAVRALNFHRKRSTCVLLTSVGCERS